MILLDDGRMRLAQSIRRVISQPDSASGQRVASPLSGIAQAVHHHVRTGRCGDDQAETAGDAD